MVSFTVRLKFNPEDQAQIEETLRVLTAATRQEPGCVNYIPHFVEGEQVTVLIYEQYADEVAVDFHRNSEHFQKYAIGVLYQKMLLREKEDLTAIA